MIFLHGLGADGHDFEPIVPELGVDDLQLRFVFPHAPERPITINEGERSGLGMTLCLTQNMQAATTSRPQRSQSRPSSSQIDLGIPPERIMLAGFSQGGVMALEVGLRYEQRIAGIIALSTCLPHDAATTEQERTDANLALPIFMGHGTADPMIPIMRAATSRENLIRLAYDIEWHDYPMGHQVCIEEIEDIALLHSPMPLMLKIASAQEWLEAVLGSFDEFLLDHAANERKASAMAMSMVAALSRPTPSRNGDDRSGA